MTLDAGQPTWLEIDLEAIRRNAQRMREIAGVGLMAVVKAGAYGHGLAPTARAAAHGGAGWLGVARVDEGLELRRSALETPILILGPTPADRLPEALEARLRLTVWSEQHLEAAAAAGSRHGDAFVHVKVDTGMNRIGARPEVVLDLVRRASRMTSLRVEGVYTHFACADGADRRITERQNDQFADLVRALESNGLRPPLVHAANTAAALAYPETRWDLVRSGIGLFGMHPSPEVRLPNGFRPALEWKTRLTRVARVPAGQGVSYGHRYVTRREERIGTIPVGYGDGFRRVEGNQVLIAGRKVPVVGTVCMDQCMVQLDSVPAADAGDEVVLIGTQGSETITAEDLAGLWGTINYEVTCGITERVAWLYR
jgi:alanine racemase